MGIFDALTAAVSGLSAQSYALQNISGNIANSQTTGYKGIQTQFEDLIGDNLPSQQIAGSVLASSSPTNNIQGDIQNATTSTFMAINGNGFFQVQQPTSFSGNLPVFGSTTDYTRRGDFELNQNGYLVNGAGYYLMGIPLDPTTGNPTGSIPQTLQFNNNLIPAVETTQIQYEVNLPSQPLTTDTQSSVTNSNLLTPTGFAADPIVGAPADASLAGTGAAVPPTVVTGSAITYPVPAGSFQVNGTTVTLAGGDTDATELLTDIGTQLTGSGVTATVNNSNQLVLTAKDAETTVNISSISSPTFGTDLGVTAGNNGPTDLLSGTVSAGQTLVVTIGTNTTTITFGTGPFGTTGKVQTLADLNSALQAATGAGSGTGVDANGNITIQANNSTSTITIAGGPASNPTNLTEFGIKNTQAFPANGTVYGIDQSNFIAESIAGGSITTYDGTGTPVNMQFRWAKVDSASLGAGHTDTWNLFYQTNTSAGNAQAAWVNVGTNFAFNSTGNLTPAISTLSLPSVSVNGTSLGTLSLNFGSNGITQFSNASGTAQVNLINQNGSAAGQLQSIAVDNEGRIVGTYSNGLTEPLASVTLANFNGPNNLKQLDGGAYEATADSGPPLQNATGTIVGSSLEASNVDIADEFSKLIVTQQAYAANTRIITTTNTMVQDLLDVVR